MRFVVVVDMRGRMVAGESRQIGGLGLREGEMKVVSLCAVPCKGRADLEIGFQGNAGCVCKIIAKSLL